MSAVLALVVFVGVSGPNANNIDRQVGALLHLDAHIDRAHVSHSSLKALGTPTRGPRTMRKLKHTLHGAAVIAGRVIRKRHSAHLRMLIYSSRGTMTDLLEVPIRGDRLDRKAIANLREVLIPAVEDLSPGNAQTEDDEPAQASDDDESPFGKSRKSQDRGDAGDSAQASDDSAADDSADDSSTDDSSTDDSSADDSDSSGDAGDIDYSDDGPIGPNTPSLSMRASVGLGFVARTFAGPESIPGYSSTAVGSVRFSGVVQPTPKVTLHVSAERTLGMTTQLANETATTIIGRWQGTGSYLLHRGGINLAAVAGLGRRSFVIESKTPMRSPDGQYTYLVAGAKAEAHLGSRVFLGALMALEPVVGGAQPTAAEFGPARRWALEMSGALGVRVHGPVFVEARAEYQRFSWSWAGAGTRGGTAASDGYPGATISLGAQY